MNSKWTFHGVRTLCALAMVHWAICHGTLAAEQPKTAKADPQDFSKLPANEWTLIHSEGNSGGKQFARVVYAENVDRLYLWGTGGQMPARNVFLRYELESLAPTDPTWLPAFPRAMAGKWTAEDFPPFPSISGRFTKRLYRTS